MAEFDEHVILLCNDERKSIIEGIEEQKPVLNKLYDFKLMENGGEIAAWQITGIYADALDEKMKDYYQIQSEAAINAGIKPLLMDKMNFHMIVLKDYHIIDCGSIREGETMCLPYVVEQGSKMQYGSMIRYENIYGQRYYNRLEVELTLYGRDVDMKATLYSQNDSVRRFRSASMWGSLEYVWCYLSFDTK